MNAFFSRTEALLGAAALARLASARVLVVGVGGVGSWCAEALVRTGLGHITLMDDDLVAESNVNRQCPALKSTIGRAKVEVMAERLCAINPACEVVARCERFLAWPDVFGEARGARCSGNSSSPEPAGSPGLDLIVDAIDSVDCKAELILGATAAGVPLLSSMGAALRLDPTKVRVTRFEKVEGDGLARASRQRFKKLGRFPGKSQCVWSAERAVDRAKAPGRGESVGVKGSLMPVTATFGMCLASEAIKILTKEQECE